jgi:hypothetical protein
MANCNSELIQDQAVKYGKIRHFLANWLTLDKFMVLFRAILLNENYLRPKTLKERVNRDIKCLLKPPKK